MEGSCWCASSLACGSICFSVAKRVKTCAIVSLLVIFFLSVYAVVLRSQKAKAGSASSTAAGEGYVTRSVYFICIRITKSLIFRKTIQLDSAVSLQADSDDYPDAGYVL